MGVLRQTGDWRNGHKAKCTKLASTPATTINNQRGGGTERQEIGRIRRVFVEALHRRRCSLLVAASFDALRQRRAWWLCVRRRQSCLRARRGLALRAAVFSAWVDARDEEKFGTMVEGPVTVAASIETAVGALAGRCDDLARHAEDSLVRQTALIS